MKNTSETEKLHNKAKSLPPRAGCYIFKDAGGTVLYAGKSKCLNKRVQSYFRKTQDEKILMLMKYTEDIEYICTATDIEAILLEYELIKKHRPQYNLRMRKDREPWYIVVGRFYPMLYVSQDKCEDENTACAGPFASKDHAGNSMIAIGEYWNVPVCGFVGESGKTPCLRKHLNHCFGPCAAGFDINDCRDAAAHVMGQIITFLNGDCCGAFEDISKKIANASAALNFEHAAYLQNHRENLLSIADFLSQRTPELKDKKYCLLLKSHHDSAFLWVYIENKRACFWMRFLPESNGCGNWKMKTAQIADYIKYGTIPKCDDFYVLNENDGEQFIKAVGEIDAKRFFIDLTDAEPEQIHEINPFEIIKTRKSYDIN